MDAYEKINDMIYKLEHDKSFQEQFKKDAINFQQQQEKQLKKEKTEESYYNN